MKFFLCIEKLKKNYFQETTKLFKDNFCIILVKNNNDKNLKFIKII